MTMQPTVWGSRAPDDGLRGDGVTTTQVPQGTRPDWLWAMSDWFVNPFEGFGGTTPPTPGRKPPAPGGVTVPAPGRKPDLDTLTGASSSTGTRTLSTPVKAGAVLAVLGAVALVSR